MVENRAGRHARLEPGPPEPSRTVTRVAPRQRVRHRATARHEAVDTAPRRAGRSARRPQSGGENWRWLLLAAVLLPVLPALYGRVEPHLFGLPFFYWIQLVLALVSGAVIGLVYLRER